MADVRPSSGLYLVGLEPAQRRVRAVGAGVQGEDEDVKATHAEDEKRQRQDGEHAPQLHGRGHRTRCKGRWEYMCSSTPEAPGG